MNEQIKSLLTLYNNLQLILTNLQNRYNKLGSQVIHQHYSYKMYFKRDLLVF